MEEALVPYRCLVPCDVVDAFDSLGSNGGGVIGGSTASLRVQETPELSDRVVLIEARTPAEQLDACRELLGRLRAAQDVASDHEAALFVILVPSGAAGAVIGAGGCRIREITALSGADVALSREVVDGLGAQPMTITGSLQQVLRATAEVNGVVQGLATRGLLRPADFGSRRPAAVSAAAAGRMAAPPPRPGPGSAEGGEGEEDEEMAPVALVVGMEAAGRLVGKGGCRVAELQRASAAKVVVDRDQRGLGMRCGDRLVWISAPDASRRARGVRAVLAALAEGPAPRGKVEVLVPEEAVGYIIGRGGEGIREISAEAGADVAFGRAQHAGGLRLATIAGATLAAQAEAVLLLVGRVDELQGRSASSPGAPQPLGNPRQVEVAGVGEDASWAPRTPAERALLAGIQASGVLDQRLTLRLPRRLLAALDTAELASRSGARFEVEANSADFDPDHCLVSVIGQRVATSIAVLYIQEAMARQGESGQQLRGPASLHTPLPSTSPSPSLSPFPTKKRWSDEDSTVLSE